MRFSVRRLLSVEKGVKSYNTMDPARENAGGAEDIEEFEELELEDDEEDENLRNSLLDTDCE